MRQRGERLSCARVIKEGFVEEEEEEKAAQALRDRKDLSRCVVWRVGGILTRANSIAGGMLNSV